MLEEKRAWCWRRRGLGAGGEEGLVLEEKRAWC